jgi:hypothetical protein
LPSILSPDTFLFQSISCKDHHTVTITFGEGDVVLGNLIAGFEGSRGTTAVVINIIIF